MPAAGFSENFSTSLTTLMEYFRTAGWFIGPILICWFISITVLLWKGLDLRRRIVIPPDLAGELDEAGDLIRNDRFGPLQARLEEGGSVLARIAREGIHPRHQSPEAAARAAETVAREEISRLERGIPVLEIIFTIAPMLGLIGTVSGLVRIFSSLGMGSTQNAEQARQIALGIAEAMNTTIAGLVVAVPALIGQVLYSRQLERLALRLATLVSRFLDTCWNQSK